MKYNIIEFIIYFVLLALIIMVQNPAVVWDVTQLVRHTIGISVFYACLTIIRRFT
jgi:hypothetical protein